MVKFCEFVLRSTLKTEQNYYIEKLNGSSNEIFHKNNEIITIQ